MNFLHSIKFRFTLWYLLVLAVLLTLLSAGIYFNLSRTLNKDLNDSLRARAEQLISIRDIIGMIDHGRFEENIGEVITFYFYSDGNLDHISPRGRTLPVSDEMIDRVIDRERILTTVTTSSEKNLRVFATPYLLRLPPPMQEPQGQGDMRPLPPGPGGRMQRPPRGEYGRDVEGGRRPPRDGYRRRGDPRRPPPPPEFGRSNFPRPKARPAALFVARDTESIEKAMDGLLGTLILAVPLTLLIAGGGGIFLAGRALTPVDQITRAARKIEESDLSRRIDVHTKDELGGLASTLNQMIERLEKAFKRQKQFTGDASHELRAPLAVIEAQSTLALNKERNPEEYREALSAVADEVKHMSHIISQLLSLARADAGRETLSMENVKLSDLLKKLCGTYVKRCESEGIGLELSELGDVTVRGDASMLRLLFSNIIENAIRHTESGNKIHVLLRKEEGKACVHITDTGMGIPEKDLPHIFDRFYRVDKSHSREAGGSGLGLAICKQITELHGGTITAESEVGKGSTFTVRV